MEKGNNTGTAIKPNNVVSPDGNDYNFNLKLMLENYISDNIETKYELDHFITVIKQKQADEKFILAVLRQLKHCIDLLDPKNFESTIINLIFFEIKWHLYHSTHKEVLSCLGEFLIDLNSAYTSYIYKCLSMLIKLFIVTNIPANTAATDQEVINCDELYNLSHHVIQCLTKIVPSSKLHLVKLFDSLYPYMTKDTTIQESYISNILRAAEYLKDHRAQLLEICIQKCLKIDVNCRREQIIEAELNDQMAIDGDSDEATEEPKTKIEPMKHPLADRLDVMMLSLIKFIEKGCHDETNKFNWDASKSIYKDLLYTFDKYVLCTYGSSHVQFLMFYVCSYKYMLSEGFIDYLWKKFSSINSCAITKQVCAYYIGSYLSRAKYIQLPTCVATLQLMIKWIHNYIEKLSQIPNYSHYNSFDMHRTFYALCQTVFYVIIFRNKQLFQEGKEDMLNLVRS